MNASSPLMDIVVAVADNGVIGRGGAMPWHLSTDLRRFKVLTLGKPLVMGRKTFEAIGRPLPGRHTLVVSGDPAFGPPGVEVFAAIEPALDRARALAEAAGLASYVIAGGGALYAATIGRADRLLLTRVHVDPEGDTVFPPIDAAAWCLLASEPMPRGERDSADATFETWIRRSPGLYAEPRG